MKTVLTYGTFDLFHIGHLRLLERARALGDRLIVGVSTDQFNELKGKKTLIPFEHRAAIVAGIRHVDLVIPEENWEQKIKNIQEHQVKVFVMGDDWRGEFDKLNDRCEVVYLERTQGISTSQFKEALALVEQMIKGIS